MDAESTKQSKNSTCEGSLPLPMLFNGEVYWAPYRGVAKMMLQSHHSMMAMMQINRRLFDEFHEIAQQEQDALLKLSESTLHRMTEATGKASTGTAIPFGELYEAAMAGVRDIGQAVVNAQVHSFDVLREHSDAVIESGRKTMNGLKNAA